MPTSSTLVLIAAAAMAGSAVAAPAADGCDTLRSDIEARIRASGVAVFSVAVVDAAASAPGVVVGSCALGTRKIVYLKGVAVAAPPPVSAMPVATAASRPPVVRSTVPAPTPPAADDDAVLTECKPGYVSIRGECKRL